MDTETKLETPIQKSFLALPPSTLFTEAINVMAQEKKSYILVVENKKILGIFTERDVVRITTNNYSWKNLTLGELMTKNVITVPVSATEDIFKLSKLMNKNRIRHLPIVDEQDQIIGIVTPQSIRSIFKPEYLLRTSILSLLIW